MLDFRVPNPQRVVLFGSYAESLVHFRGPLIAEMVKRGHEVHALAPDIDQGTALALASMGAKPRSVKLGRTSLDPMEAIATARQLTSAFREICPDLVIAYTIKPVVLGAAAAKAAGVKKFVPLITGLGYAFTGGLQPKRVISRIMGKLLYKRAFSRSTIAIFQNPDDLHDFRGLGLIPSSLRTAVINGSGVDIAHYAPAPLPSEPSFLMVARLLGDKGVREFGEAARRLKQVRPDIQISLAGWIDSSPDSIGQTELDQIISSGVDYLGPLADVRPAMAAHSVYVLPSYREGTPRSVLEAMSMGRAIITTDAPGCRETVAHGVNGLLVPPRDSDALHQAIVSLIDDPQRLAAMGKASRNLAEDKFDVGKVNATLLAHVGL